MRILMIGTPSTFCDDWADAARTVADVVQIRQVKQLTRPPIRHHRHLAAISGREAAYELEMPPSRRPARAGAVNDFRSRRRLAETFDFASRHHGPIDLWHAHFYSLAKYLPHLRGAAALPYVITEHSSAFSGVNPDNALSKWGYGHATKAFGEAQVVMPVSRTLANQISALGLPGNLVVVPNPVDAQLFKPALHDRSSTFHLVTTARLVPVKRLDLLLRAVQLLRCQGLDVDLTVIGRGPLQRELEDLRDSLGLVAVVRFLGKQNRSRIAQELASADIYVNCSMSENLSVSIIEGLLTGLPVVATNVGGAGEMIDARNGILVVSDDVSALVEGLSHVLASLSTYNVEIIRAHAMENYAMSSVGQRLEGIYGQAMKAAGQTA